MKLTHSSIHWRSLAHFHSGHSSFRFATSFFACYLPVLRRYFLLRNLFVIHSIQGLYGLTSIYQPSWNISTADQEKWFHFGTKIPMKGLGRGLIPPSSKYPCSGTAKVNLCFFIEIRKRDNLLVHMGTYLARWDFFAWGEQFLFFKGRHLVAFELRAKITSKEMRIIALW